MATGACGINCDVCRLNLLGLCTTCGAGKSEEARVKLETQKRVLGDTCPVLSCVVMNRKNYCIRDCNQFPCENYQMNPYPFSEGFLHMQKRRRESPVLQLDPWGEPIVVPLEYWQDIRKKTANLLAGYTLSDLAESGNIVFPFLDQRLVLDMQHEIIRTESGETIDDALKLLIILSYFKMVDRLHPVGKDLVSSSDMHQAFYFQGRNGLKSKPVFERFSDDKNGLLDSARALGGHEVDMADAAVVLYPFPAVPVYYLIWDSEEEFQGRASILFDRSIESVFQPPVIWGLVNLLNAELLTH